MNLEAKLSCHRPGQFQRRRTVYPGRTRSSPVPQAAADSDAGDHPLRKGTRPVHYRHTLPHPPGHPGAEILSFDNGSIRTVDYEDTDSFIVTEMFIRDRALVLKHLLEGEE